jgi:hypothetical protein
MNKKTFCTLFYCISFTWGIILNLFGCVVSAVMLLSGHKPKKWGCCYYFEIGENWGGFELGVFFIVNKNPSDYIKTHEAGHGLQNCFFGPLMILITTMSTIRYWYRAIREKIGYPCKTKYADIWFEKQADVLGQKMIKTVQND